MSEKVTIEEHIQRLIDEHLSTAEEYFQDIGDSESGNEALAKVQVLKDLLTWIQQN